MRLLKNAATLAAVLVAAPAFATPMVCHFEQDCMGANNCIAADVTMTVSSLNGPTQIEVSDMSATGHGSASPRAEGRTIINAMFAGGASLLLNINGDGSADTLVMAPESTRALFGSCTEAEK